jgi:2-oxoglutarate ferredoxin oxidoreductase subunit alpha
MNAAALKTNLKGLKKGGKIIVNTEGFDSKNSGSPITLMHEPIEDESLQSYVRDKDGCDKMTRERSKILNWEQKKRNRAKTCSFWAFFTYVWQKHRQYKRFLQEKSAQTRCDPAKQYQGATGGFNFGIPPKRYNYLRVERAKMGPRGLSFHHGQQAAAYGLIAASQKSGCSYFLAPTHHSRV